MKIADYRNIDPRLVETRKLMFFRNFTAVQINLRIIHELITSCSLNTINLLTTPSRLGHNLEGISNKSYSFLLPPKLCLCIGTSEQRLSFSKSFVCECL